jgi:hypothetical protein
MYKIVLECNAEGLSSQIAEQAVMDIADEFRNRPWHTNVRCTWDGTLIRLEAENDFDDTGLALSDEFSDAIAASIAMYELVKDMRIVSVTRI